MPEAMDHFRAPAGPELLLEVPGRGARRRAVEESLRAAIRSGSLAAGTRLPSTRDLAAQLGLARGMVAQAYEQLAAEGWLSARSGSGTRVAASALSPAPPGRDSAAAPLPRHDLRPGQPDARAFPRAAWTRAVRHALGEAPADAFGGLGPAVRLGWIACPPLLLEPLAEEKRRARPTSLVEQLALARLIDSGDYDRHLRAARRCYRERRDLLAAAVRARLPRARLLGIEAGLHAILELPDGSPDEPTVMAALRTASIGVHQLGAYARPSPAADGRRPSVVVGYGTPPAHAYPAAISALVERLRELTGG